MRLPSSVLASAYKTAFACPLRGRLRTCLRVAREPLPHRTLARHLRPSTSLQLFVDPFLISHADGLETLYHTATYEPLNPVLASDRPWEVWQYGLQSGEGYCGVATPFSGGIWWDPTAAEYKLYYRCGQTVCLAISADALRWTKPALDVVNGTNIVVRGGDVGRVTVWLDLESRGDEPDAGRWKMSLIGAPGDGKSLSLLTSDDGVHFRFSGRTGPTMDGGSFSYNPFRRRWVFALRQDTHMCGGSGDSFQTLPTRTARYAEVPRGSFLGSHACASLGGEACATNWTGCSTRSLCNNISGDSASSAAELVNWIWSDLRDPTALSPDHRSQLYSLEAVAYESVMVGFFSLITAKDESPPRPYGRAGEQDAVFLGFSRDGFHWYRPEPKALANGTRLRRTAFLPMSTLKNSWNFQNVQGVGGSFLVIDAKRVPPFRRNSGHADRGTAPLDVLNFFVGARSGSCAGCSKCTAGQLARCALNGNASTGVASLRRDGFASLTVISHAGGGGKGGVLRTRTIQFDRSSRGNYLFVNVALAEVGGSLRIGLLRPTAAGALAPIQGYGAHEMNVSASGTTAGSNSTQLGPIQWSGGHEDLSQFAGQAIQLEFSLSGLGSSLYSFWVSPSLCAESNGPVAAGGRGFAGSHDTHGRCR